MSRVCFVGETHAAHTMAEAAHRRGHTVLRDPADAALIFLAMDTPTKANGERDLETIRKMVKDVPATVGTRTVVLTSQVPPGFTRSLGMSYLYHQSETLRIEDALQRAMFPEMFIVGAYSRIAALSREYREYMESFDCPILVGSYEDAEFSKIAINMTLAAQVENANRLSKAAEYYNARWEFVSRVLRHDSRIGKYAYLTPGRWQDSRHLLRDHVTLEELLK